MVKGWGLRPGAFVAVVFLLVLGIAGPASAQQCGPTDVVFVIDNSGSMGGVIANIQAEVGEIAAAVEAASGGDYQFGLVALPSDDVVVLLDMSANNRQALDTAVDQMSTAGSCGGGISYDEGLNTVLNNLGPRTGSSGQQTGTFAGMFRPNATKIIIVITDTGPDGFGCTTDAAVIAFTEMQADDAAAKGIRITGVFVPTGGGSDPSQDIPIMQDMVARSGGLYKETLPDASDLSDVIIEIVNECGGQIPTDAATLIFTPREIFLTNLESFDGFMTDFIASPDGTPFTYVANGLPEDSSVTFIPTDPDPAFPGTTAQILRYSIGPETVQGVYPVVVTAIHPQLPDRFAVALVFVDCQPPLLYGTADSQPQSQSVDRGATARLSALPSGTGPFTYQWYNGARGSTFSPVAGGTGRELTTPAINGPENFWVRISGPCGSVDSATATVTPR
jgi:hypothetical protein